MSGEVSLLDLGLVLFLPWLAWQALHTSDLFRAIVSFIVFGLLIALSWSRLHAPDVALAEAAIGAGLTGALFFVTLAQLQTRTSSEERSQEHKEERDAPDYDSH
ncbi:MAG: Na(+)/H(+) antiporter subunit B [Candidatus Binatia bacterium]